jgi:putative membrane protein
MSQQLVHLLVSGVSVLLVAFFLPGMRVKSYGSAVGFALVVALLNALVWKGLAIIAIPVTVVTLGIGGFLLNGVIFLVARSIVPGIEISGCLVASFAALGVTVVDGCLRWIFDRVL